MSASYTPAVSRNDQSPVAQWFWTVDRGLLGAALAASVFHSGSVRIPELKTALRAQGIEVRDVA